MSEVVERRFGWVTGATTEPRQRCARVRRADVAVINGHIVEVLPGGNLRKLLVVAEYGPKVLLATCGQRVRLVAFVPDENGHAYMVSGQIVKEVILATVVWGPPQPEIAPVTVAWPTCVYTGTGTTAATTGEGSGFWMKLQGSGFWMKLQR